MASTEDLALLSWDVYENKSTVPYGWTILQKPTVDQLATGLYAVAYQNTVTQEIVIAYRGTTILDVSDLGADIALTVSGEHPQFVAALEFANAINRDYGEDYIITVTGHSLGGGLAQLAADVFGWGGVTFDAPGMDQLTTDAPADQFDDFFADTGESFGHVTADFSNLTVIGSVISAVGVHIGARNSVEVENGTLNVIELMAAWGLSGGTAVPILLAAKNLLDLHAIGIIYETLRSQSEQGRLLDSMMQQFVADGVEGYNAPNRSLWTQFESLFNDQPALTKGEVEPLIVMMEGLLQTSPLFDDNHTVARSDLINAIDQLKMSIQTITVTPPDNLAQWTEASGENQSIEFTVTLDMDSPLQFHDQKIVVDFLNITLGDYGQVVGGDFTILGARREDLDGDLQNDKLVMTIPAGQLSATLTLIANNNADLEDDVVGTVTFTPLYRFDVAGNIATQVVEGLLIEDAGEGAPVDTYSVLLPDLDTAATGDTHVTGPDGVSYDWSRWFPDTSSTNYIVGDGGWAGIQIEGAFWQSTLGDTSLHPEYGWVADDIVALVEDWNIHSGGGLEGDRVVTGDGSDAVSTVPYIEMDVGNNQIILAYHPEQDGPDTVETGAGRDWAVTVGGNDTIILGSGQDLATAGDGDDQVEGGDDGDMLNGGSGNDYLSGDAGDDLILGDGTYSVVYGGGTDWREWGFNITHDGNGNFQYTLTHLSATTVTSPEGGDTLYGGQGTDILLGQGGDDFLSGDEDVDALEGGEGNDLLSGGTGDDWLWGDDHEDVAVTGNDTLLGDAGLDHLTGGPGDDVLHGGADADALIGDVLDNETVSGADSLYGGEGDDELIGGPGDDYLDGGLGADALFGDQDDQNPTMRGNDTLMGGAGTDNLTGGAGNDQLFGGDDNDELFGDLLLDDSTVHGDDYLDGGAGVDTITGDGGNDYIRGGEGNDEIQGDRNGLSLALHGRDTIYGDAGEDLISGQGGDDLIYGGTEDDELQGNEGDDVLYGEDGNDTLFGLENDDALYGGIGGDHVWGGTGNDLIRGESGGDWLYGEDGDDDIDGGSEDDHLDGGIGNDRLAGGSGIDTLLGGYGNDTLLGGEGVDTLRGGDGDDLLDGGDGNEIYLQGGAGADTIYGVAGNDTLQGEAGDDILDGGIGTDLLSGGTGDDQFRFGRGYGADTVLVDDANPAKRDAVVLADDILTTDVVLKRGTGSNLDNLILSITGTADTLTLPSYFSQDGESASRVEEIRFADGTVWDVATVKAMIVLGTSGNDTLTGFSGADNLFGYGGTDTLWARAGNDYLDGGPGTDTLQGGEGDDVLYGGTGNDTLYGASGNDTYRFGSGDGNDAISNGDASVGRRDVVEFTGGLTPTAIGATRSGDNLVLRIAATGEALTVNGYFTQDGASDGSVDEIRFADGTVWDIAAVKAVVTQGTASGDTLYGYATDDVLSGLAGNDTLRGGLGNDTLDGGPGTDTLYGEQGDDIYLFGRGDGVDTVRNATNSQATDIDAVWFKEDVNPEDISLQRSYASTSDDDLQLSIIGTTSDRLILDNYFTATSSGLVDRIEFADGTMWTEAYIRARLIAGTELPDSLRGYQTSDTIDGLAGNDTLRGEAGADHLFGGTGTDTIYGGADGDDIHGGDGDDPNLNGEAGNDQLFGEAGNDKLFGGADADALDGGVGNDRLEGGAGNDTYYFYRGAGADVLRESREDSGGGTDTVRLTGGILPDAVSLHRDGDYLIIALDQSATQLVVENFFFHESHPNNTFQIERIEFDNGVVWDLAGIYQRVIGGVANSVSGGSGNDLFVVDHQADVVSEASGGGVDTVEASVTYTLPENVENLTLTGYVNINGTGNTLSNTLTGNSGNNLLDGGSWEDDLLIGGPGDDTFNVDNDTVVEAEGEGIDLVVLKSSNWYFLPEHVENLRNESNSGGRATLYGNQSANTIVARTTSNDIVYGQGGDDTLIGGSSSNVLYGDADNDTLSGLNGNDELYGGTGDDVLDGGSGSDRLDGGEGDDVYVNVDAADTLVELPGAGVDTVQTTISFSMEALGNFENLTLTGLGAINGTGNSADNVLTGNAAANTLVGGEGADTLTGAAGNDVLDGGNGDDTYVLNSGDGFDFISDGSGSDSLVYGPGIAFGDVRPLLANGQLYLSRQNEPGDGVIIGAWGSMPIIENFVFEDVGQVSADVLLAPRWSTWFDAEMEQWNVTVVTASGYVLTTAGGSTDGEISGSADDDLLVVTGYALAGEGDDVVYGQNGNDRLDGGAGSDRLAGGRGDDVYYVDDVGDVVVEGSEGGADVVNSSVDYILPEHVERLTLTGADAVSGTGNVSSNTLDGSQNTAANMLLGGLGDDLYIFGSGDGVVEYANGGLDTVYAETGYILEDHVENLKLTGGANVVAIGNDLSNHLVGNSGNNDLSGREGDDRLDAEGGDDTLNGGIGADEMFGGQGNDTYYVDDVGDRVAELSGQGMDIVDSLVSYELTENVEVLRLSGEAAINGTGNDLNNVLRGNDGANTLMGGTGNDDLNGRSGDDTLLGGAGDDFLNGGQGNDTYRFGRGDGKDLVSDYDPWDADPVLYGVTVDAIRFGADIDHDSLWFTRLGKDLQIGVIGSEDQMTIQGWYRGEAYQAEEIYAGDGYRLLNDQVEQLVQAMAAFAPPPVGESSLPDAYRQDLDPVIAANWQSAA